MPFDRANLLYLLHILEEYSDGAHILPMSTIIAKMKSLYNLTIDRRTVYGAIELLQSIGYDISIYSENGKGYYLRTRMLEASEARLLMDAVYSFPCISAKQTADLIKKIQTSFCVYERKQYLHLTLIKPERKTENRSVLYNVDILDEAISKKRIVAFTYLQYGPDKKLHPRRENEYTVNPHEMLCVNERYYLLCIKEKQKNISFYRIDLMKDITLTDRPIEKNECAEDIHEVQKMPYAFPGHPEPVVLRCNRDTLGGVIDRFGTNITILEQDESSYTIRLTTTPHGAMFWALQYLPYVEILQPLHVRQMVMESILRNPYGITALSPEITADE